MDNVIGLDFGTTDCRVAVWTGERPVVIPNDAGSRDIPSVVGFGRQGERLIGQLARRQAVTNAENTIGSLKRLLGRKWQDSQQDRQWMSCNFVPGAGDQVNLRIREQVFSLEEVAALLCWYLKQMAEAYLETAVTAATIAVPTSFTAAQRQALRDAATIAGFDEVHLISDPLAIALGWAGEQQALPDTDTCLVLDWGGGSLDAAIVQVQNSTFTIQSACGMPQLGGDDFDRAAAQWLLRSFLETDGIDLSTDRMAIQRLREAAVRAKLELSRQPTTVITLPFITADETGPRHLEQELSRQTFETLTQPLIDGAIAGLAHWLQPTQYPPESIRTAVIVGGTHRLPGVQAALQSYFPHLVVTESLYPAHLVALGAATHAAIQSGQLPHWQAQGILVDPPSPEFGLSASQLANCRQQLAFYAAESTMWRQKMELRNAAETLLYNYYTLRRDTPVWRESDLDVEELVTRLKRNLNDPDAAIEELQNDVQTLLQEISLQFASLNIENFKDVFGCGEDDDADDGMTSLGVRRRVPRSPTDSQPNDTTADGEQIMP